MIAHYRGSLQDRCRRERRRYEPRGQRFMFVVRGLHGPAPVLRASLAAPGHRGGRRDNPGQDVDRERLLDVVERPTAERSTGGSQVLVPGEDDNRNVAMIAT